MKRPPHWTCITFVSISGSVDYNEKTIGVLLLRTFRSSDLWGRWLHYIGKNHSFHWKIELELSLPLSWIRGILLSFCICGLSWTIAPVKLAVERKDRLQNEVLCAWDGLLNMRYLSSQPSTNLWKHSVISFIIRFFMIELQRDSTKRFNELEPPEWTDGVLKVPDHFLHLHWWPWRGEFVCAWRMSFKDVYQSLWPAKPFWCSMKSPGFHEKQIASESGLFSALRGELTNWSSVILVCSATSSLGGWPGWADRMHPLARLSSLDSGMSRFVRGNFSCTASDVLPVFSGKRLA